MHKETFTVHGIDFTVGQFWDRGEPDQPYMLHYQHTPRCFGLDVHKEFDTVCEAKSYVWEKLNQWIINAYHKIPSE